MFFGSFLNTRHQNRKVRYQNQNGPVPNLHRSMSHPIYCSGKWTLPKPPSFVNWVLFKICTNPCAPHLPFRIQQPHSIHVPYLLLILGFNLFKAGAGHLHAGLTRKWPKLLLIFLVEPITIHLGSKTEYWKQSRRIIIPLGQPASDLVIQLMAKQGNLADANVIEVKGTLVIWSRKILFTRLPMNHRLIAGMNQARNHHQVQTTKNTKACHVPLVHTIKIHAGGGSRPLDTSIAFFPASRYQLRAMWKALWQMHLV